MLKPILEQEEREAEDAEPEADDAEGIVELPPDYDAEEQSRQLMRMLGRKED